MWLKYLSYFRQYIIFITGGGIGLLLDMIITYILTEFFNIFYMVSYAIAIAIVFLVVFIYHTYITFKKHKYGKNRFIKFVIVELIIIFLNWCLVYIVTESLKIHYLISIFFISLFLSVFNYTLNRKFVFIKQNGNHRIK